ncbi:hypothetical protein [Actinokineospora pegani]|uniref:hypothetical protein n=1 Tax=Actinokineospora pegani TaxID=2654637 RepID=UPI0012EA63AA|nr:hypothetical protein [Actinokineospora pegani]
MSGQAAALGFEYQFLQTIDRALAALGDDRGDFTGVVVDAPPEGDPMADREIVDFALMAGDRCRLAAQVKGGASGSVMSAADAVRVLLRLLTHDAEQYVLITSRRAGPGLLALIDVLRRDDARDRVADLVSRSPQVRDAVLDQGKTWFERLCSTRVVLDDRTIDELRDDVRERVRTTRRQLDPDSVAWDAAGLLTGYLVAEVLAKAARADMPALDRAAFVAALQLDHDTLRSVLRERGWAVPLTPVPRATDIARPDMLARVAQALPTPVRTDVVPVCVLTGLSGIGKTATAAAWVDDRADAYASVIWIEAATDSQIEASFVAVASQLTGDEVRSGGAVRDAVHTALAKSARPWLMVFDNALSLRSLREWLPTRGPGHVLVTTVDPTGVSGPRVKAEPVRGMTEEQAVQLLTARLLPEGGWGPSEIVSMRELAATLEYWPLALELAAAYLNDCLGGLSGARAYERLLMRSLADEDSVPVGYPNTLVRAIQLGWERMLGAPGLVAPLAVGALRFASFFATRRIPVHLLLAAILFEPRDLVDDAPERGPRFIDENDLPVGEVVRAMRHQSLAERDVPLWDGEYGGQVSAAWTMTMNEIVQTVLRQELRDGKLFDGALGLAAFHAQHWLTCFFDQEDYPVALLLRAHIVSLAEHALSSGSTDYAVALLYGNASKVLDLTDSHELAVRYLRAELVVLDKHADDQPVLRVQAAASLARATYLAATRPADAADDIADALELVLTNITAAYATKPDTAAHTVRFALSVSDALAHDGGVQTMRAENIRLALRQFSGMMPLTGRPDLGVEVAAINTQIKDAKYDAAVDQIERLLRVPSLFSLEKIQLMSLRLECRVWQRKWDVALRELAPFSAAVDSGSLRVADASSLVRNVGLTALHMASAHDPEAFMLLERLVALADRVETSVRPFQVDDRVVADLFRGLCAAFAGDVARVRYFLDQIGAVVRDPSAFLTLAKHLLRRWVEMAPRWPLVRRAAFLSAQPTADRTFVFKAAVGVPVDARPTLAVAVGQAYFGVADESDGSLTAAVDLACAFDLLGVEVQVIRTTRTLLRSTDDLTQVRIDHGHHVVYAPRAQRMIDPGLSHAVASTAGLPSPQGLLPGVVKVADLDALRHTTAALMVPNVVVATYDGATPVSLAGGGGVPGEITVDRAGPLLTALRALHALCAAGDFSEIRLRHPDLADLLIKVDLLSTEDTTTGLR